MTRTFDFSHRVISRPPPQIGQPGERSRPAAPVELGPVTTALSSVTPEHVEWLWLGRLARGKVASLDGDPGIAKSTLAMTMAAHITAGRAWPDGAPCVRGDVLLLSAEDGLADTVRPRLDAAGGDATRVHALTEIRYTDEDGQLRTRLPTLADVDHLESVVRRTRAVLVIIDVLMAYLPSRVDAHRDQDIRSLLAGVSAMAERQHCAVLLLRHLNKAAGGSALYRGGGSIGIIGAVRVGLLAAPDPDGGDRRVLAGLKCNLAELPEALAYRLVNAPDHGCAKVEWLGSSGYSASALLSGPHDDDDREEADELVTFLQMILDDEPDHQITAVDATKKMRAAGFLPAKATLYRARKRAGIRSSKSLIRNGGWIWSYTGEGSAETSEGFEGSGDP